VAGKNSHMGHGLLIGTGCKSIEQLLQITDQQKMLTLMKS